MYRPKNCKFCGGRMQKGGKTPIVVSDINDPRLKAYNDSLSLYNRSKKIYDDDNKESLSFSMDVYNRVMSSPYTTEEEKKRYASMKPSISDYKKYGEGKVTSEKETNNYLSHKIIKRRDDMGKDYYYLNDKDETGVHDENLAKNWRNPIRPVGFYEGEGGIHNALYKKPVQPVVYKSIPPVSISKVEASSQPLQEQLQERTSPNVDVNKQIKTNYTFNYRNPQGGQSTDYFPDYNSWSDFMKNKQYIIKKESADKSSAEATGYKLRGGMFQDGGIQLPTKEEMLTPLEGELPILPQEKSYTPPKMTRIEEMISKGLLETPRGYSSPQEWFLAMSDAKKKKQPLDLMNIGLFLRGTRTGLGSIGNMVERGRQNQYMYDQFSALGQMNPMPANDYQPNPYSLYARYGGSLKKYLKGGHLVENQKFTNEAKMRMDKYRELK